METQMSEKESLDLITRMINKARASYHDTGIGAIMWGGVVALCALLKLSEIQFKYALPFDVFLLTIVAIIPQVFISIKEKKERKSRSYDDVFLNNVWLGFGICMFLMSYIITAVFNAWNPVATEYRELTGHGASFQFSELVTPLLLLLYGLPTFITGSSCNFKPMLWGGIFCWVCSVITIYTPIKIDLLLMAVSAIIAWLIPGLILDRAYRQAQKQRKALNV